MIMKYIILMLVTLSIFTIVTPVSAQETEATFETKTLSILDIKDTNMTWFAFGITTPSSQDIITNWKVRLYCDEDIALGVNNLQSNDCGTAVSLPGDSSVFALTLQNETDSIVKFSFKLKGYDKDGNWVATAQQSFQWK